jgi:arylsulfatase
MAKPFKWTINVDTEDYPGKPPYQFTGGVIDRVAIDVSGEPYHDLEREAALMLMRE